MAGPNPYRVYSFEELRAINGRSWLVCEWCRRYAPLAGDLRGRDTRTTTFSCAVCGGEARHVLEDPGKSGLLQFDPRPRQPHHADAAARLKAAAEMRRRDEERYSKVAREDRPQAAWRAQPKPQPRPRYTLTPFPVRTFGDIAAWGLAAQVDCRSCLRPSVPLEVGENLKTSPLLGTRLRCTSVIRGNALAPDRVCGGHGRIFLSPVENGSRVPGDNEPFIGACCYNDIHTALEAQYLVRNKPPWEGLLGRHELFACPGCGRRMHHSWSVDTRPRR